MDEELRRVIRRVIWFEPPEQAIQNEDRLLTYFMQYCLDSDLPIMQRYFSPRQFRHALNHRPPGILDARSVAYWDLVLPS